VCTITAVSNDWAEEREGAKQIALIGGVLLADSVHYPPGITRPVREKEGGRAPQGEGGEKEEKRSGKLLITRRYEHSSKLLQGYRFRRTTALSQGGEEKGGKRRSKRREKEKREKKKKRRLRGNAVSLCWNP